MRESPRRPPRWAPTGRITPRLLPAHAGGALTAPLPARLVRALSSLLIAAGLLALLDAGITLVWQEPLTALYATIQQDNLRGSLRALERAAPTQAAAQRLALVHRVDERIALLASELERKAPDGSAVGRIEIPRIGASFVVVNGTSAADLEEGPGIYSRSGFPQRTFPGLSGTTAVAGHRTTYLAPFRHIDALRRGNRIVLTMPYGRFTYTVSGQRVVSPNEVAAAVDPVGYPRLVLSACTPLFSAAQRILVFARLTDTTPLGAAHAYDRRLVAGTYPTSALARALGLPDGGLRERI
jgi:sortase A